MKKQLVLIGLFSLFITSAELFALTIQNRDMIEVFHVKGDGRNTEGREDIYRTIAPNNKTEDALVQDTLWIAAGKDLSEEDKANKSFALEMKKLNPNNAPVELIQIMTVSSPNNPNGLHIKVWQASNIKPLSYEFNRDTQEITPLGGRATPE